MTTPKSEEEILSELEAQSFVIDDGNLKGCKVYHESIHDWLRSALASYLMHLKEEIPEKDDTERIERLYGKRFVDGVDKWGGEYTVRVHSDLFGHNSAIDQVHALLDEKIRKLTE